MSVRVQPSGLKTTTGVPGPRVSIFDGEHVPVRVDELVGPALGVLIASDRVVVDVVGHDAGGQVVRLVEQHRLPAGQSAADRSALPSQPADRAQLLGREQLAARCVRIQSFSSIRLL